MRLDLDEPEEQILNLTPFIDVLLFLLIFFLASTTFAKAEVEMSLDLPKSEAGKKSERVPLLIINVARDGALTVDGRVVTAQALKQKLQAAASRSKDQEVLIRGDTRAQFGLVAEAFDACLSASLRRVSIAAQPVPR